MNTKRNEAVKSDDQCSYHSPQATGHKPPATSHSPLSKWLREPLLHFFILGLVVFGLHGLFEKKPETAADPFLVEVTSADIEWFRTMWSKRMGREPTVEELRGQVNQLIREQVLSREAVSMGLDEGDVVVRRRLAQKMNFLFKDLSDITEPTDGELKEYLQKKRSTYEIPQRMTFTHVYFNTDRRGQEGAEKAIQSLIRKLNTEKGILPNTLELGDPFLLQSSYSNKSPAEIRREFGSRFTETVFGLEPRTWQGPVVSGYGLHAVYIHEHCNAELPDFSELKERLKVDWIGEKQREITLRIYEKLLGRYQVLVEGMPYHMDISG
jgi:peptidyl-prolyl cis-trans isomerase C